MNMQKKLFAYLSDFIPKAMIVKLCLAMLLTGNTAIAEIADNYEYETASGDNTYTSARAIEHNAEPEPHTIHEKTDEDWLKFKASNEGTYRITVSNAGEGIDIALELYDSSGTRFMRKNTGFEGEGEQMDFLPRSVSETFSSSYYYIRVFQTGFFGSNTKYTIQVAYFPDKIIIESGNNQTVPIGSSLEIIFKLIDNAGKKISNGKINFFYDTALLSSGETDPEGKVIFRLEDVGKRAGSYTITAQLENNTKTKAQATVNIIAGQPSQLVPIENATQTIKTDTVPLPILFELTDSAGNAVIDQSIIFTATMQTMPNSVPVLVPMDGVAATDKTDGDGQVRFIFTGTGTDIKLGKAGIYKLKASTGLLPPDNTIEVTGTASINVADPSELTIEPEQQTITITAEENNTYSDIMVTLKDSSKNHINGATIEFTMKPGIQPDQEIVVLGEVVTQEGVAHIPALPASASLTIARQYTVTATLLDWMPKLAKQANIKVEAGLANKLEIMQGENQTTTSKNISVSFKLIDDFANGTTNGLKSINATITKPDSAMVLFPNYTLNSDGTITVSLNSENMTILGEYTITVRASTNEGELTAERIVTVKNAAVKMKPNSPLSYDSLTDFTGTTTVNQVVSDQNPTEISSADEVGIAMTIYVEQTYIDRKADIIMLLMIVQKDMEPIYYMRKNEAWIPWEDNNIDTFTSAKADETLTSEPIELNVLNLSPPMDLSDFEGSIVSVYVAYRLLNDGVNDDMGTLIFNAQEIGLKIIPPPVSPNPLNIGTLP